MTHLCTSIDMLVNLHTMQLPNDNTSHQFYHDRDPSASFALPKGFSLIITDVIVNPEVTKFTGNLFYLTVITVDGGRSITVRSDGRTTHLPLAGGLAVPAPHVPSPGSKGIEARNTTFSSGPVEVQLLGYFAKVASGLGVGKTFSP